MITYKLNTESGFLETVIKGKTTVQELINYILTLSKDNSLPKILKIYTDAREGRFTENISPEDMPEIVEANIKSLAQRNFIYDAFVLSSSVETALGIIYSELSQENNYKLKIFSTKKAALNWLKSL